MKDGRLMVATEATEHPEKTRLMSENSEFSAAFLGSPPYGRWLLDRLFRGRSELVGLGEQAASSTKQPRY